MATSPTSLEEARTLTRVQTRACRLFEDGYRARWISATVVEIDSPTSGIYEIDTEKKTCDCPFFKKASRKWAGDPDRTCKHLLGLEQLLERQGIHWKQQELADPEPTPRPCPLSVARYKGGRHWAVRETKGGELVIVTLYRKGAVEVVRRLTGQEPEIPKRRRFTKEIASAYNPHAGGQS
jgi:hypothetical protein